MLKGIYTAAAGMLGTEMAIDTLASNLANVSTIGFRSNRINFQNFPEMLIQKVSELGQKAVGGIMTGSQVFETFVNTMPGTIRPTGNPFDLAIQGDGYFTVKSANGDLFYTRAGNFRVDDDGYLTTTEGLRVQGKLGDIRLNQDQGPFNFSGSGQLTGRGQAIDQLQITRFENNQSLQKVNANLYAAGPAAKRRPGDVTDTRPGYSIVQGSVEESNVNPVMELVNTIQGQRLYEALQKNIHMHNSTLEKAVNEVGRYR
jgi:flagellar basal-body rod protein FlgG